MNSLLVRTRYLLPVRNRCYPLPILLVLMKILSKKFCCVCLQDLLSNSSWSPRDGYLSFQIPVSFFATIVVIIIQSLVLFLVGHLVLEIQQCIPTFLQIKNQPWPPNSSQMNPHASGPITLLDSCSGLLLCNSTRSFGYGLQLSVPFACKMYVFNPINQQFSTLPLSHVKHMISWNFKIYDPPGHLFIGLLELSCTKPFLKIHLYSPYTRV